MRTKMCGKSSGLLKTIILVSSPLYLMIGCSSGIELKTETEIAAYADSITGFQNIKGITKTLSKVVITDDNTPFLHTQINGKKVWLAEYKNFRLPLSSRIEDKYIRNFKVYIDPKTRTILKITSKYDGYDPNLPQEPNAAVAERQIKDESYSFPKEPPKINFLDALNAAQSPFSSPLEAKEIDGLYVWYSSPRFQKRCVWIISTWGVPSYPWGGPPGPKGSEPNLSEQRRRMGSGESYYRTFIDAVTGKTLFIDNAIRPEK